MFSPVKFFIGSVPLTVALTCQWLGDAQVFAVELVGRAVLPSATFASGPTSGWLSSSANDVFVPFFEQQPVQGISAVLPGPKPGTFLIMPDNGFGSKVNSPDFLLRFYGVKPDFVTVKGGSGEVFPINLTTGKKLDSFNNESFVQLNDRAARVELPIVAEQDVYPGSTNSTNPNGIAVDSAIQSERLLTGGDFDIESFRQDANGTYWFGDEFGPFLIHIAADGELLQPPIPLPNFLEIGDRPLVQSPDHPTFANLPNDQERVAAANLPRSKGFEGTAINPSGTKLYAMLEGALVADQQINRLLIHEFDIETEQYTGNVFAYRLEDSTHAIGDLTAINDHEFLVIERDNRQGDPNNPAFTTPAEFKRIYKIDITQSDREGFVAKELLVDLLNIRDPNEIGGNGTTNGIFTFPFVTIESVLPVDEQTLLVINDNNYPSSVGRTPGKPDDNEFILIQLDRPLKLETGKE